MVALALELLATLARSTAGRVALGLVIVGAAGFWWGYHEADKGRLALLQQVKSATDTLRREEAERNAGITAEGERESLVEEREDAERERLLADANAKIAELEKATPKCVIPREMVRQLNRGR